MLQLSNRVTIPDGELDFQAVRSGGPGGQHVNKVASAIHLRFDVRASSLPDSYKEALLALSDSRLTDDGVLVIKAQRYRSQEQNKQDALARLEALIRRAMQPQKKRTLTKPTRASRKRRLEGKKRRSETKNLRGRVDF